MDSKGKAVVQGTSKIMSESDDQEAKKRADELAAQKAKEQEDKPPKKEKDTLERTERMILLLAHADRNIKRLESLRPEDVIDFLHSFSNADDDYARKSGGDRLSIKTYISGILTRELKFVHKSNSDEEILATLRAIEDKYDDNRKEDAYHILEDGLKWNFKAVSVDRACDEFFNTIQRIMGGEIEPGSDTKKAALKIAIAKLPKEVGLRERDYTNIKAYLNAGATHFMPKRMAKAYLAEEEESSRLECLERYVRLRMWAQRTREDALGADRIMNCPAEQNEGTVTLRDGNKNNARQMENLVEKLPTLITSAVLEAVKTAVPPIVQAVGVPRLPDKTQNPVITQIDQKYVLPDGDRRSCYFCGGRHLAIYCPIRSWVRQVREQNGFVPANQRNNNMKKKAVENRKKMVKLKRFL